MMAWKPDMKAPAKLSELEAEIGYRFRDISLLETALTHSSYANEHEAEGVCSNERLEFLGDAVTGLETALMIFNEDSSLSEGRMTTIRAALVRSESLAGRARLIGLGKHLRLGVGAEKTDVRENATALEDAFEALIAAVFLDGGASAARSVIRALFGETADALIKKAAEEGLEEDYKSRLQTAAQRAGMANIRYVLLGESGPDHAKRFRVAVVRDGKELGTGEGRTKKQAEKMAAKMALGELKCI